MLMRGQTAVTLLRYLCHLFPRIITRYSTCHGRNFEALFAVNLIWFFPPPAGLTGVFVWENYYFRPKALVALPPSIQSSHNRELHVHRHSQACLHSNSTSSTAELIYHRQQYCWLPRMLSLLKDVWWLSCSSNFDESFFFIVIQAWIFCDSQNCNNQ